MGLVITNPISFMDHKRKFFLFKQSKNFCSVPWNYFKVDQDGTVKTCVKGQVKLGNINHNSIQEILQTPEIREIRRILAQDQVPANCATCREQDHQDTESSYSYLRDMYNDWFKQSQVDYDNDQDFCLSGVDLHWSNVCNIKCITCWPQQSSAIAREFKVPIRNVSRSLVQELTDWIVHNQHSLREIYFSGGEPTLIKHNAALLQQLEPRPDLLLRVNSNMTFDASNEFVQQLQRFPRVLMTMSADAMQDRFEYIRQGATWQQFLDNVEFCQQAGFELRVNSVFFVSSAATLLETQNFFRQRFGVTDFTINQLLIQPLSLMSRNLPDTVKAQVLDQLTCELAKPDLDNNLRGQLVNCSWELQQDPNGLDYRTFFDDVDRRRGTDWKKVYQELL
jgi:radical SAM protein with 4Fe4S-binding SPASM domain